MREYSDVAIVSGKKSLDGRLVVKAAAGLPLLLQVGMLVHFVPPQIDVPRSAVALAVSMQGERSAIAVFDSVDNSDLADALVGCHLLVASDELPEGICLKASSRIGECAPCGWTLKDANTGLECKVEEIDARSAQPLCKARGENGESYLIPLAEELVLDVDEDAETIILDCPKGIFEL